MSLREEGPPVERDLQRNTFSRSSRLRKSKEFRAVFKNGKKIITEVLVFHLLANSLEESRLGLAISRKVGKAVKRNKVKRRIREAFRQKRDVIPGCYDLVVYPRKGILEKQFDDYLRAFDVLGNKLKKKSKRAS